MKSKELRPFHLAFPVSNIKDTKKWYTEILGCTIGRESNAWIDFDFFGHQISAHLSLEAKKSMARNKVDSKNIPVRHFGIILDRKEWKCLAQKLIDIDTEFIVAPYTRFKGEKGEQSTLFIKDPSGNYLEFKSFANDDMIFDH